MTDALDRFVLKKVKSGRFENASEVVRGAPGFGRRCIFLESDSNGPARFWRRAEADLLNIGDYTLRTGPRNWLVNASLRFENCCRTPAWQSRLGAFGRVFAVMIARSNLLPSGAKGHFGCRILHGRMLPQRHFYDVENPG